MTEQQLRALGPALARFLGRFAGCCRYAPTFAHLRTYVRGLLSDLPRKTAEPIALAAGTPARTLQEFLRDHAWDAPAALDRLRRHVADLLPSLPDDGLGAVGLVDETSVAKQGDKTPGVQRQYLGCLGKVENGVVTVHLGVSKGRYKALVDAELFLPEGWSADRPRCRAAGIPDGVVHRTKWQMALSQLDRARAGGLRLDWLTFDAEYGKRPGFLAGLDARGQRFVGEVPGGFGCLAAARSGRRPDRRVEGRPAGEVVRAGSQFRSQPWRVVRLARETTHEQVWRVKAARVWVSSEAGWSAGTYWLVWASRDDTGEEKFFVSNAPPDAPTEALVRAAFRRAGVEHAFRVCKSELGLTHFEGRSYRGLMRHLTLGLVTLGFVAEHTERLRGEKPGADGGAGVPSAAPPQPRVGAAGAGHGRASLPAVGHRVSPAAEPGGPGVEAAAVRRGAASKEAPAKKAETADTV
jgi:SRSO17 transposase